MQALLKQLLQHIVRHGDLEVTMPDGSVCVFGDGSGTRVGFSVRDTATTLQLVLDPDLHFGEAYMEGAVNVTRGTIHDVLRLLFENVENVTAPLSLDLPYAIRRRIKHLQQANPVGKARQNVAHHYDLSGALYDIFLDEDRQYSCAYFEGQGQTLESAQLAKKRHLAAKLMIEPGMKVLDIGSGWGGLGLYLAQVTGAQVTGVTLSEEQYRLSNERAARRGLQDKVQFLLKDYRELDGEFDRIVSVGMFEHVGVRHYGEMFTKVRSLLQRDGIFLLHSIGRSNGPGATSAWIRKYIFPGGYAPALSEVMPEVEKAGLYTTDVEILRLHYARTLAEWRKRFAARRDEVVALYDERFARMWEFYLSSSELSFRHLGLNNFQLQAARHQEALPFTRDYIAREEERLKKLEQQRIPARKRAPRRAPGESVHYPQLSKQ
ncbi:MAG: cyclopropane-fatty-acyl-phospholipid synthase family protein [Anderseniella sp.]|jgi:cyclopropane-fatty-acyl-phospholipid synthase|nr:cyclopropane-fatty-acyl-phospholipid synthase family protein [Anderseniella sp.]